MKKVLVMALFALTAGAACAFGLCACDNGAEPAETDGGVTLGAEVRFIVNGQIYKTVAADETSAAFDIPPSPEANGYTFGGWYLDEGTWAQPFTAASLSPGNLSVYAKMDAVTYSITYNPCGGTHDNPATYTTESPEITLSAAAKTGYTFSGWYTDENFNTQITAIAEGSYGDLFFYAKFTVNSYTISFADGAHEDITQDYGTEVTAPARSEKPGYTFVGWYISGEDTPYRFETMPAEDITLTAKWTLNAYKITYHGVDGVTNENPATYNVEAEPITLSDAIKAGYTFSGWYTDENCTNGIAKIAEGATGDLDLYAKWAINTYTVTFKTDDDTVSVQTFTVENQSISEPLIPDKAGYTKAWEEYTLAASDITINAVYTPVNYFITYENTKGAENGNPASYTIESGNIALEDIASAGYVFDGWFDENEVKVTEIAANTCKDITLYAKWTEITLGDITYDESKKAIRVYDTVNAELFGIECYDNFSNEAEITVELEGNLAAGKTVAVRVTAESGSRQKQITIADIKVYAMPEIACTNATVIASNIIYEDTDISSLFTVKDSFGETLKADISVANEQKAGNSVVVAVTATDVAGNVLKENYTFGVVQTGAVYTLKNGEYELTSYSGTANDFEVLAAICDTPVTSIAAEAFKGNTALVTLTIQDGVKSIGERAFCGCISLISATIGADVESIGASAFEGCYKLIEICNLSALTIETGEEDNGYAGYYAENIYTATEGESKLSVSDLGCIFYMGSHHYLMGYIGTANAPYCPNKYNNNTYAIYKYAFYGNTSLTGVTIGSGVTAIDEYAFCGCSKLTSAKFNDTTTWTRYLNGVKSGTLSSSDLSDTSTAAKYLTTTYCNYTWLKT